MTLVGHRNTAIYSTMKLKTMSSNKWFSSLSIKNDNERKKEKGHLVGHYMIHYTLAFENGCQTIMNNHAYL